MSPDLLALQTQMQAAAGQGGKARVWRQRKTQAVRAQVRCMRPECQASTGQRWSSRSDGEVPGEGSSVEFALDLWAEHLEGRHQQMCPWSAVADRGEALKRNKAKQDDWWAGVLREAAKAAKKEATE